MDQQVQQVIDAFFTRYKHKIYAKGELLVRAGENPGGVFYLKQGTVKEYGISKKGDEVVLNIFKPISFFPMSWVINDTPNNYFYEAITTVEAWSAPKEKVIQFLHTRNDVLYDLLRRVYIGVDGLLHRMEYLMIGSAYERFITELLIVAKRFGKQDTQTKIIQFVLSEKDLAAQTGMTRETVSRAMKQLKDKRLVMYTNGVLLIHNLQKLEEELF